MDIDVKDLLNSILKSIDNLESIKAEDIPGIDLYMDQVTTFMEEGLSKTKRHEDDKILTKTMINNYAKNNLLPPPVKKKYSKEHVLILIFIYYFKNLLSIRDIGILLAPLTDKYFGGESDFSIEDIYREVWNLERARIRTTEKDITRIYRDSMETFSKTAEGENLADVLPEEEMEQLRKFAFLCSLAFDVYVKKLVIEKIIDEMPVPDRKKKKD